MRALACLLTAIPLFVAKGASAQSRFAEPPREPLVVADGPRPNFEMPPYFGDSTARLHIGPALRLAPDATDGGLWAALDVGKGAAGFRASGAWVRSGSERGLSQYTGELWVDFGTGRLLHPVIGAGAGVARLNHPGEDPDATTVGIGVLRGTLECLLPVNAADARAGVDLIGSVPAIRGSGNDDTQPWLLAVARVGIGF